MAIKKIMRSVKENITITKLRLTSQPLHRLIEAKKRFPHDHPFVRECERAKDAEYRLCKHQEVKFELCWRYTRYLYSHAYAKDLMQDICRVMEVDPITDFRAMEGNQSSSVGGYYEYGRQIIYMDKPISLSGALHELAHHIDWWHHPMRLSGFHGNDFCQYEQQMFDLLLKHQHDEAGPFAFLRPDLKEFR